MECFKMPARCQKEFMVRITEFTNKPYTRGLSEDEVEAYFRFEDICDIDGTFTENVNNLIYTLINHTWAKPY